MTNNVKYLLRKPKPVIFKIYVYRKKIVQISHRGMNMCACYIDFPLGFFWGEGGVLKQHFQMITDILNFQNWICRWKRCLSR